MIDETDQNILSIIQKDGRVSNAEIARKIGMAPSAVLERIRKLETRGIIQGYKTELSPQALGMDLLAFVFVQTDERVSSERTGKLLADIPEVQEVHHVSGEDCYLVKVRTANTHALGKLLRNKFGAIQSVVSTRSTIVLDTIKETTQLSLIRAIEGETDE